MANYPPAWYPQPDGTERWWDGLSWTPHVRGNPTQPAVPVPVPAAQGPIVAAGQIVFPEPGGTPRKARWGTWLLSLGCIALITTGVAFVVAYADNHGGKVEYVADGPALVQIETHGGTRTLHTATGHGTVSLHRGDVQVLVRSESGGGQVACQLTNSDDHVVDFDWNSGVGSYAICSGRL